MGSICFCDQVKDVPFVCPQGMKKTEAEQCGGKKEQQQFGSDMSDLNHSDTPFPMWFLCKPDSMDPVRSSDAGSGYGR